MINIRRNGQPVFIFMLVVAVSIAFPFQCALAALVPTDAVTDPGGGADARGRLMRWLAREDLRLALAAQGLDAEEVQARVASLTDTEIEQLAGQLDKLPAGGDALATAIAVLLIAAILLLIMKVSGML
jgi:hypothetical protein